MTCHLHLQPATITTKTTNFLTRPCLCFFFSAFFGAKVFFDLFLHAGLTAVMVIMSSGVPRRAASSAFMFSFRERNCNQNLARQFLANIAVVRRLNF